MIRYNPEVSKVKHYALENPFTDRECDRLNELYPFVYKNYIDSELDQI